MKKLKIAQITPGLMEITRAKQWGAIERVEWNYKQSLEKLGHTVDIKFLNEIQADHDYDIIHIHAANLIHEAVNKGLSPIYSIHDHHVLVSDVVSNYNKSAIDKSIISIVHGHNILKQFQNTHKCKYLRHGVDINLFRPSNKIKTHSLLCVANNGLAGDTTNDRKGFRMAVEIAKHLKLDITIAGPKNNLQFFEANKDLYDNVKLNILTDLDESQLIDAYQTHKIFLHFSNLEAGHPNLTLLEALSCGLPIIGTTECTDLKGMEIVSLDKKEILSAYDKINNNYESYYHQARQTALNYSWDNIAKELELIYLSYINQHKMQQSLRQTYSNIIQNTNIKNKYFHNFLSGAQFEIMGGAEETCDVKFIDQNSHNIIYHNPALPTNHWARPSLKYYVNWEILVNDQISYKMDLNQRNVLICLDSRALGDTVAWIPYADEFRKKHNCHVTVTTFWNELFEKQYPELEFLPPGVPLDKFYAYYLIGCNDNDYTKNKNHWRTVPLQQVATDFLGLEYNEIVPKILTPSNDAYERVTNKKYVAISQASTLKAKFWNNPKGWETVINYIKSRGYEVVLLQKEDSHLTNVIKKTGIDIKETLFHLNNAEFFIGLGSGISWLAWALGKPVIMISGFSQSYSEFYTPHRVINTKVCHGCYNDIKHEFNRGDWNWCVHNKNFICTTSITPEMVIKHINQLILI